MSLSERVDKMTEEKLGVINARHLARDEYESIKPCILFLTSNRIIVATLGGINPWTVVTVIVALIASFIGLILREFALFLGGLGVGIISGLSIVVIDFAIRHLELRKVKRLSPERILQTKERNFEIRYAEIAKVEVRTFKTYPKGSFFLPSLPELTYSIDFITDKDKDRFILDKGELQLCLDLLHRLAPKTIEIEEVEADE